MKGSLFHNVYKNFYSSTMCSKLATDSKHDLVQSRVLEECNFIWFPYFPTYVQKYTYRKTSWKVLKTDEDKSRGEGG